MKQFKQTPLPRRRFLQQLMVLGGTTGAGILALNNAQAKTTPMREHRPQNEAVSASKGYRLTEHIRTYYKKAQI